MSTTLTASSSHSSLNWITPSTVPLAPFLERVYLCNFADPRQFRPYIDNLADFTERRGGDSDSLRLRLCKVRSVHPSLRHFASVDYHYDKDCWVVYLHTATKSLARIGSVPLYVGRRPVYLAHGEVELSADLMDDILDHEVDPTTVVSDDDMQTIRKHIRYAYAVRLHVWGFWDVLFRTSEDLFRQKQLPIPSRIGSLGFAFIISEHRLASGPSTPTSTATPSTSQHNPSSTILPSTQVTGRIECDFESSAYVGLCINLRGKRYLTTASHAFVSRDTVAGRSKTDTAIRRDRKELQSTLHPTPWTRLSRSVLDYIFQRDRRKRYIGPETSDFRTHLEHKTSDVLTPVNVPVYLEGSGVLGGPESQLGRIAKTYDDLPWRVGPHPNLFPTSFKHDLALVEAADDRPLPKMVTQDWHPRSRPQFARAEDCLVQTPAFLVQHLPKYSERRVWKKGSIALQHLKQVLISGVDYLFDSEGEHVTRALIWRTEDDLRGASGSVVCRGNSKDKEVDAVIFQNFETTLSQKLSGYTEQAPQPVKGSVGLVNYKGGFFLPKEILDALIEVEAAKNLTTTFSDDFKNDFTKPEKKDQNTIPPSTSDPLH